MVALLGAAVVAVPLFKRLGLGSVLGYLAAGLAIGKFGLGLFSDGQTILHVAELGVVIFLFVIGLEMKPSHLWHLRRQIFGLGSLQVVIAAALLTVVGMAFGFAWQVSFVDAAGFAVTLIDKDENLIAGMEKYGVKTYFGDGSRPELLLTAGIEKATVLVVAIDNKTEAAQIVRFAREANPHIKIVARAYDRTHTFELHSAGADEIIRETFDSGVRAGKRALEFLGLPRDTAESASNIFYRMDRSGMKKMVLLYDPEQAGNFSNKAMMDEARRQDARVKEVVQAMLNGEKDWDELV